MLAPELLCVHLSEPEQWRKNLSREAVSLCRSVRDLELLSDAVRKLSGKKSMACAIFSERAKCLPVLWVAFVFLMASCIKVECS